MDSLGDLLGTYKSAVPPEIAAIKKYVFDQFRAESSVSFQGEAIMITVPSAALANALRLRTVQLQQVCGGKKKRRIIFRIG